MSADASEVIIGIVINKYIVRGQNPHIRHQHFSLHDIVNNMQL